MVVIEDPSGFVGTKLSFEEMEYLAKSLYKKGGMLVIDEAYLYVHNHKSRNVQLVNEYANVVLAHTLSKAHGLAGARIGFLVAQEDVIDHIARVRPLFEISALSA